MRTHIVELSEDTLALSISAAMALLALFGEPLAASSSQGVGPFPGLSGGFEDEPVTAMLPVLTPVSGPSSTWTVQSASGPASVQSTGGRSGPNFLTFGNSGNLARRLQSPTAPAGAIVAGGSYIMQFYYRSSGSNAFPAGLVEITISAGGTTGIPYAELSLSGTSGAWRKAALHFTAAPGSGSFGLAVIRFTRSSSTETDLDLDDFAIYHSDELPSPDLIPPEPPMSLTASEPTQSSVQLNWSAPPGGVDGGGYVLVRGGPGAQVDPNTNGIYAVGNTTGPGQTVIYIGTNTSFVDTALIPGTTYGYRLYTVDKAFNYSSAAVVIATTPSEAPVTAVDGPRIEISGGTNWFLVYLGGGPGKSYGIETAALLAGPWTKLQSITVPTNDVTGYGPGVFVIREAVIAATNRFYRATRIGE